MKITPVCGNAFYSIRFVEFTKNNGHPVEAYFELIQSPFKCIGIFNTAEEAKDEMKRLTELHCRALGVESTEWVRTLSRRA